MKTAAILTQFEVPPSPYTDPQCRLLLFEALAKLVFEPQTGSPVSLSLLMSLLKAGVRDPTRLVSAFCIAQLANLERLIHPAAAPLAFSNTTQYPTVLENLPVGSNKNESMVVDEDDCIELSSDGSSDSDVDDENQNQINATPTSSSSTVPIPIASNQPAASINMDSLEALIQKSVENALRNHQLTANLEVKAANTHTKKLVRSNRVVSSSSPSFTSILNEVDSQGDAGSLVQSMDQFRKAVKPKTTNGHSKTVDDATSTSDSDSDVNIVAETSNVPLRFSPPHPSSNSIDDNTDSHSLTSPTPKNSSKPIAQGATTTEGPSVDEMMECFVDLEPGV